MKNTNGFENRAMRRERERSERRRSKGAKPSKGMQLQAAENIKEEVKVIVPDKVFKIIEGGQEFALILSGDTKQYGKAQAVSFVKIPFAEFTQKVDEVKSAIGVQGHITEVSDSVFGGILLTLGKNKFVQRACFVGGMLLGTAALSKCDTEPGNPTTISGSAVAGEDNETKKKPLKAEDIFKTPQKASWGDMGLGTSKPKIATIDGKKVVIFRSIPSETEDREFYYVDCDSLINCSTGEPQLLQGLDSVPGNASWGDMYNGKFYFSKGFYGKVGDVGYNQDNALEVTNMEDIEGDFIPSDPSIILEEGVPYLYGNVDTTYAAKKNLNTGELILLEGYDLQSCGSPDKDETTGLWIGSKEVEMEGKMQCKLFSANSLEDLFSGIATYLSDLNLNSEYVAYPSLDNQSVNGARIVVFTKTDADGKPSVYFAEVYCGDGICSPEKGENSTTCEADCPVVGPDTVGPDTFEPDPEIVDATPDVEVIEVIDEAGDTAFELEVPIGDMIDESAIPDTEDVQGDESSEPDEIDNPEVGQDAANETGDPDVNPEVIPEVIPEVEPETTSETTAEQVQDVLAGVFELDPNSNCGVTVEIVEEGVYEVVIDGDTYDVCTVEFYVPGIDEPGILEFYRIKDNDGNIIKDGPVKATCRIYPGKDAPECDTNPWTTGYVQEDGHMWVYKYGGIEMVASASEYEVTPVEIDGKEYLIIMSFESTVLIKHPSKDEIIVLMPGVAQMLSVDDGDMKDLPPDWQDMPDVPNPELTMPEKPNNDIVEEDDSFTEDDTSGDTIETQKPPKDDGCSTAPLNGPTKSPASGILFMISMAAMLATRKLFGKKKEA